MTSAVKVCGLYIHNYNWYNLFLITIYLEARLGHWQRRETFESIKHRLVGSLLPEFDLCRNSLGLLQLKVYFSMNFFFARENFAQLWSYCPCAYTVRFLHTFWPLGLTQIIRPKQSYLYSYLPDRFPAPCGYPDYHIQWLWR